jgi:ankyrin repeat protein
MSAQEDRPNVSATDKTSRTALHLAAEFGQQTCVNTLLNCFDYSKEEINRKDYLGKYHLISF